MATFIERDKVGFGKGIEDPDLPSPHRRTLIDRLYGVPWWGLILLLMGVWVATSIADDPLYSNIFRQLREGIGVTLHVSLMSYVGALVIGVFVGIIRSSTPRPQRGLVKGLLSFIHLLVYNIATLFVEVIRGLPILIVLLVSAFVILPELRVFLLENYGITLAWRGSSIETGMLGLALMYGAFLSEIFRAGIQSIERGQIEAARSLGMTPLQTMGLVVLPQAVRRVLPPLGNDFISMIKDSSLVAFLGVRELTQIARVTSGSTFRYLETYLIVAVIYLTMTLLGSLLVRLLERYMKQNER